MLLLSCKNVMSAQHHDIHWAADNYKSKILHLLNNHSIMHTTK